MLGDMQLKATFNEIAVSHLPTKNTLGTLNFSRVKTKMHNVYWNLTLLPKL